MKSARGFVWLPVLLGILGVLVVSGGAYWYEHPGVLPAASQEAAALTEAQIQSVLGLLTAFSVPQATISNVNNILHNRQTPTINTQTNTTSNIVTPTTTIPQTQTKLLQTCFVLPPQLQTLSCPAGQTGSIVQTRTSTCPGPVWSAWQTTSNTCKTITTKSAPCAFNGQSVANGQSVTAYQTSSVPAGQQCVSQQRICTNGTLNGSYTNASCSVTPSQQTINTPSAAISVSPKVIPYSGSATLSWTSSNATSCNLYGINSNVPANIPGNISTGVLTSTTDYNFGCSNATTNTSSGWKTVTVTVCAQGQTVVNSVCTNPPSTNTTVGPTQTYTDWYFSGGSTGLDGLEWDVTVNTDPTPQSYFYATQFWFFKNASPSGGGYFGIQTQGTNPTGKIAIFSIWNALDSNSPQYSATFSGEGSGRTVRISYAWVTGRTYHLRIAKLAADSTGQWWGAYIIDTATGVENYVGQIEVSADSNEIYNIPESWTEYYGTTPSTCSGFNPSNISFANVTANGGTLTSNGHNNHLQNPVQCPGSSITDIVNGASQIMGE